MKIIGCYIVKDEARALERSLASIKGQVDELVVVDTGSADDTIRVAQTAGAQVFSFPWKDDFAAVRNYALAQLHGDWVVFLDADEYFSDDTASNLRSVITVQKSPTNLLLIHRQDVDENGQAMLSLYVPRIFRIKSELRYTGAIHEELRQNGQLVTGITTVSPEKLNLVHTGYAGSRGTAKARRNLAMLLREAERNAEPVRLYGYLAEAYDGLNDRENAMKYAYLDINRGRQAETYASRSYRLLMTRLAERRSDYVERLRVVRSAVKDYPELPEFHAELAESLAAAGSYGKAQQEMQLAINLGQDYHGLEPTLFTGKMAELWQKRLQEFIELEQIACRLKISACAIVKNEADNIGKWLENVTKYADECIVLDTGSTDDTYALAKAGGAQVEKFDWQDDFSEAKNALLQKASGDWLVVLDADEYIDRPEALRGIVAEWEFYHHEIEILVMTNVNVDVDDGNREISHNPTTRVYRNGRGLKYKGRVHERLLTEDGHLPMTGREERLRIIHTGYSTSLMAAKTERNLALLQQDIAEHGEQPQHYRYLAESYYELGKYGEAQLYALRAIEAPVQGIGMQSDMYYITLQCMKAMQEPVSGQLAFAEAAARKFPALPDFPAIIGILYHGMGDYYKGYEYLAKARDLALVQDDRESSSFGDIASLAGAIMADCLAHLGRKEEALAASEEALVQNPYEEQTLAVYCSLRQDDTEWLKKQLTTYFGDNLQDIAFLCRFCERNGFGDLYNYYRRQWEKAGCSYWPRQKFYQLLSEGDWDRLAEGVQAQLAYDIELMVKLLLRLENKSGRVCRQTERQILSMLPDGIQKCWQAIYMDKGQIDWQVYKTLWRYVLSAGETGQITAFVLKAADNQDLWQELLQDLREKEVWEAILQLLSQVPMDKADGRFWQDLGQCLYHCGEYAAAKEALDRARQSGCDSYLLQSYEAWLAGRKTDD